MEDLQEARSHQVEKQWRVFHRQRGKEMPVRRRETGKKTHSPCTFEPDENGSCLHYTRSRVEQTKGVIRMKLTSNVFKGFVYFQFLIMLSFKAGCVQLSL